MSPAAAAARARAGAGAPRRRRGFTLIEVVVALAVVSIGLAAALTANSRVAWGGRILKEKTLASWIAQNRIAELRLQAAFPAIGESDGEIEFGNRQWFWETEVSATQVEALRRIEVKVRYTADDPPLLTLVGFVGQPTPPGAGPTPWNLPPGGNAPGGLPGDLPGEQFDLPPGAQPRESID